MAHIAKYKAHSVGHMLAHYRRDPSSFGRDNVDASRVGSDYTLGIVEDPARGACVVRNVDAKPNWDVVRRRIERVDADAASEGRRRTRKDAVVLADLVITLPDNVPTEDERRFFGYAYAWVAGKVGRENLLGGFVHRDEVRTGERAGEPVRDHMHVPFTPILDGRFNYKKMVPRDFYKSMHGELGDYLEQRMGYRPHVELSQEERAERVYADKSGDIDRVRDAVAAQTADAREERDGVQAEVADLGARREAAAERLECLQATLGDAESMAAQGLGGLRRVAREGQYVGGRERAAQAENRELGERVAALEGERRELGERVAALEGEGRGADARMDELAGRRDGAEGRVRELGARKERLGREVERLGERVQGLERRAGHLRELCRRAGARLEDLGARLGRLLSAAPALARYLNRPSAELLGSWGMLPWDWQAREPQRRDAAPHPSPDDLIRQARADVMDERTQPQQRRGFGRAR